MAVTAKALLEPKYAENTDNSQYTSTNAYTIIDKFTASNTTGSVATISVNLVPSGGSAGATNLIVDTKSIQPGEVYTFPELVGHILNPGDFVSTIAGTASAIVIRLSGRVIT